MLCAKSCLTLCDPLKCSPPGSSHYGILQARVLGWVPISPSRGSFQPRDWTNISCIAVDSLSLQFFTAAQPPGKPIYIYIYYIWKNIYICIYKSKHTHTNHISDSNQKWCPQGSWGNINLDKSYLDGGI